MKLRTLLALPLLLLAAFQFPTHNGTAVNDIADIIPAEREDALRQQLHDYERQTSIAIVVATVPSLEGKDVQQYTTDLFAQWGVGQAGEDNGLLVLVAPNDRQAWIEPGYGLESEITSSDAQRIFETRMVPAFRNGDFVAGITDAVDQLIAELGTLSADARKEQKRIRAEAARIRDQREAEQWAQTKQNILDWILGIVTFLAGAFGLGAALRAFREWKRKRALRRHLRETVIPARRRAQADTLDTFRTDLEAARSKLPLPQDQKAIADGLSKADALHQRDEAEIETALEVMKKDPDAAKALLDQAEGSHQLEMHRRHVESRVHIYLAAAKAAPTALKGAEDAFDGARRILQHARETGYRAAFDDLLAQADAQVRDIRSKIDRKDPEAALEVAQAASSTLQTLVDRIQAQPRIRAEVERAVPTLRTALDEVENTFRSATVAGLTQLKEMFPANVWTEAEQRIGRFASRLETARHNLVLAESANRMDRQQFDQAYQLVRETQTLHADLTQVVRLPGNIQKQQQGAKGQIVATRSRAQQALASAQSACRDSDVTSRTKGSLRVAEQKLQQADTAAQASMVDFVAVLALYEAAAQTFEAVRRQAKKDSTEAEEERRRKKRQEEEAARRRAAAISSSSSSFSSGGFSSGGGSSFGGFGGGSSGGGGGGGSW